jgi:hypothetical protein
VRIAAGRDDLGDVHDHVLVDAALGDQGVDGVQRLAHRQVVDMDTEQQDPAPRTGSRGQR